MTISLHQATANAAIALGAGSMAVGNMAQKIDHWVGIAMGVSGICFGITSFWFGRKRRRLAELQAVNAKLEKEKLILEIANERRQYNKG